MFASYFCYGGTRYSVFGTEKGIYVTGYNDSGQLGLGHQNKIRMPKKIAINEKIVECVGCSSFILFKTEKNEYYISGKSSFGHYLFPTQIKSLKKSIQVSISESLGVKIDAE